MSLFRYVKPCVVFFVVITVGCAPLNTANVSSSSAGDIVRASWPVEVRETSGIALHKGLNWTVNDSGGEAVVYAINNDHGIEKKIYIRGAKNVDWESLAQDDEFLYIADCGNNRGNRSVVQIYKVQWLSLVEGGTGGSVAAEKMDIHYADFPEEKLSKEHNFDCEALTVVDDELWLFTKGWGNEKTKLYRLNKNKLNQSVLAEQEYNVDGLITGADFDPLSRRLVLLGYDKNLIFGQSFIWLIPVDRLPLWENAKRIKLHPYAQWEAVVWNKEGKGNELLLTSERSPLLDESIGRLIIKPELR
ncbi:hypothetical protein [Neptuniibacter sp. 1_MG-2023]|uniref:hypothetical protein n=1 Tax=Neptuniibacter sp. 1_MG-2023 TaxID=3062662 RepID=UPI0026E45FDF|nr:hypothetical protein [Neptuniibacter sp. 1_MG-2023]MDO6593904.1 hypothetical protein [Neptuniibacter sp. 1_MG-2023]